VENVELFPLWQGGQLNKSYIKGHIAVFASWTIKKFHLEAATSLASVPVEVKFGASSPVDGKFDKFTQERERNILTCHFEE
jgi:hypothetical protein